MGVVILSMASNTLAQDYLVIVVESCKGGNLEDVAEANISFEGEEKGFLHIK